MLEPQIM